jgi:hypothetical protein
MKAKILTAKDIRNCDGRDYNPQIWDRNIDTMLNSYNDVVFYKVDKDKIYSYDRYFVEYTLPDGLRLFGSFGYSSSITSGGFFRLEKQPVTNDGRTNYDLLNLMKSGDMEGLKDLMIALENAELLEITHQMFRDSKTGEEVMLNTSKEARSWMTERSIKFGITFTKGI